MPNKDDLRIRAVMVASDECTECGQIKSPMIYVDNLVTKSTMILCYLCYHLWIGGVEQPPCNGCCD